MKLLNSKITWPLLASLFCIFALGFNACTEQSPLESQNSLSSDAVVTLYKQPSEADAYNYPLNTELTIVANKKGEFQGGQMKVENGTTFSVSNNTLSPPEGWTQESITLTMEVDMDPEKNELIFTFGPSGCQFTPSANIWFNYADLGISAPKLYYIDSNGNYVEQAPEVIDYRGNQMMINIDHFSRYAIGME